MTTTHIDILKTELAALRLQIDDKAPSDHRPLRALKRSLDATVPLLNVYLEASKSEGLSIDEVAQEFNHMFDELLRPILRDARTAQAEAKKARRQ